METSITLAAVRRFIAEASEFDTLFCNRIRGFHIVRTKTGASYRYKYKSLDGRRRTKVIGLTTEYKPQQAAEVALGWRNSSADPHKQEDLLKQQAMRESAESKERKLGDYLAGAYALHQSRKKSGTATLNQIRNNFGGWLDRDMSTLSRADVLSWQAKKEAEWLAHATLTRAYGALKTLLNHAVEHEVLERNPLGRISLQQPSDKEIERQIHSDRAQARRPLTDAELGLLHEGLQLFDREKRQQRTNSRAHGKSHLPSFDDVTFPHWFQPFALLSLHTGLRPGDLRSLTWRELNMHFKRLVKMPEKTRHHPDPAQIVMNLTDAAIADIKPWWEQQGKPDNGWVFPSPKTGEKMSKGSHLDSWRRVRTQANLPEDLDFYALRHDFISRMVAAGVPLLTVARLAGHKSAKMIEKHYGHLCPDSASNALNLLESSRKIQQPQQIRKSKD